MKIEQTVSHKLRILAQTPSMELENIQKAPVAGQKVPFTYRIKTEFMSKAVLRGDGLKIPILYKGLCRINHFIFAPGNRILDCLSHKGKRISGSDRI